MRSIFWSSIKAPLIAASFSLANPCAAQYYDIYGEANRLLPAAQDAYQALPQNAEASIRAQRTSNLIMGLIGKAKFKEAYELYLETSDLDLHPDAVAGAIGHGLVAFVQNDATKKAYVARLIAIVERESCSPCYARTFAAHHLARYFYLREDDLPKSVEWHKHALDLAHTDLAPSDPARVNFAYQYASYLRNLDLQAAGQAVRETEAMALELLPRDDHIGWLYVFLNNALVALDKGRIAEAADLFSRIADIGVKEWGESDPQLLAIYQNIAVLLARLGQTGQAVEVALHAQANEAYSDERELGYHRALIARLLFQDERPDESVAYFRRALAFFETLKSEDVDQFSAQSDLANVLSLTGNHAAALALIEKTLPYYQSRFEITNTQRRTHELIAARVFARAGDTERAVRTIGPVVQYNETILLDTYARDQDRLAIASDSASLFQDSMALALVEGDLERAWRSAQLTTISDLALAARALTYPGDGPGFARAIEAVRAARLAEEDARTGLADAKATAGALRQARAAREAAEQALEEDYPDFAEFLRPRPFSIAEAQDILRDNEAYILPVAFPDRVVTIALTREGLAWGASPTKLFSARNLIRQLRASLDAGLASATGFDTDAAHELYTLIFTPAVQAATSGKSKFIFPAAGALERIPPSVLISEPPVTGEPPAYLIRDHAVAITAGLGARDRSRPTARLRFAGIGAPRLGDEPATRTTLRGAEVDIENIMALPSLPGALAELTALKSAFRGEEGLLLTGDDATETGVRAAPLDDYQVLAFATHGLVSGQIDGLTEPALVMTPAPQGKEGESDGLLTASEIATLKLAADWIILSACNTAAGDGRGNATYSGLARAFQLAGARSLLLSHWPVRDDAATRLSVATVTAAAQGAERSEALRQAQLALMADAGISGGASPSIWAAFVLIE